MLELLDTLCAALFRIAGLLYIPTRISLYEATAPYQQYYVPAIKQIGSNNPIMVESAIELLRFHLEMKETSCKATRRFLDEYDETAKDKDEISDRCEKIDSWGDWVTETHVIG